MNKRKLLICCSLITVLLAAFSFHIYADENTPTDTGNSSPSIPYLDSYFYDNYDLLPYLESDGSQYINTEVKPNDKLIINTSFASLGYIGSSSNFIFGSFDTSNNLSYGAFIDNSGDRINLRLAMPSYSQNIHINEYNIIRVKFDKLDAYLNNEKVIDGSDPYNLNSNICLFGRFYDSQALNYSKTRLYSFTIYDSNLDSNNDEVGYVRYYYPAKAKASGTIGLYDAVSKTFVTTLGSVPFDSPVDDNVMNFQIGSFLTSGLGWIGQIFNFVIEEPLILTFMAIGLAGVMFRWGRRLVRF